MAKKCEQCGQDFECGAAESKPCWCFEIEISEPAIRQIRNRYNDCLCPTCLRSAAVNSGTPS